MKVALEVPALSPPDPLLYSSLKKNITRIPISGHSLNYLTSTSLKLSSSSKTKKV
jgi:hypothetical protein